ncbi:hypothetical protein SANTM175S_10461 [Streptomyces antimycoticus]
MPPRSVPTARQVRLGTELRRMREGAGLSIQEAADRLGINRTHITNLELARFGVSEERVRALAAIYACPDSAYVEALVAMTRERKGGWWEEYRGHIATGGLDLAELEYYATSLRVLEIMHMPGLLQTEEYARAVLGSTVPQWSATDLRRRLSHRMKRRDILDRDDPPSCTFIIHEAALRMRFGTDLVLRAQLDSLLESSERKNVTVRVLTFEAGRVPCARALGHLRPGGGAPAGHRATRRRPRPGLPGRAVPARQPSWSPGPHHRGGPLRGGVT